LRRLQKLADSGHGPRSGLAAVAQIEDEARVAHDFATESGGRELLDAQEFFDFSK
jgi:hypothetical protein